MTKLEQFRCNRCNKIFTKDVNGKPSEMKYIDRDILMQEEWSEWDLCEACVGYLRVWIQHDKDFDKFAESMAKKWETEDDER